MIFEGMNRRNLLIELTYKWLAPIFVAGYAIVERVKQGSNYAKQGRLLALLPGLADQLKPTYRNNELTWKSIVDVPFEVASTYENENIRTRTYQLSARVPTTGSDLCMIVFSIFVSKGSVQVQVFGKPGDELALRILDKASQSDRMAMRVGQNDSLVIVMTGGTSGSELPDFQIQQCDVYCLRAADFSI